MRICFIASFLSGIRSLMWGAGSETGIDAEEEAAIRREWREVHEAIDVLIAKVRDFGIEAPILRPVVQIAPTQVETQIARAGELIRERLRQSIRECNFAQLDERAILDVGGGVTPRVPRRIAIVTQRLLRNAAALRPVFHDEYR